MILTNRIAQLKIAKESDKAYGFKAWGNYEGKSKCWEMIMWCPKSIVKDGIIPDWFLNKKMSDYHYEGINVVLEMA